MPRLRHLGILGAFIAMMAAPDPSRALFAQTSPATQYQVLNPWAEVDPLPLKGLSAPRLDNLTGKKIGLFANYKRAAMPIGQSLEKRLRSMYPGMEISIFHSVDWNVVEAETRNKDKFAAWVKGVDAVILMVGD
jgi:hypothetical protein